MKYSLILLFFVACLFNTNDSFSQKSEWPELDKSPQQFAYYPAKAAWRNYLKGDDRNMSPQVRVSYASPAKKERVVFGTLVPYGQEWRLGANEATEVLFYQAVEVGGVTLGPGFYTLSALVERDHWIVNFSTQRHIWGNENRDQEATVASVKVMTNKSKEMRENFAIGFKEIDENTVHMLMEWENTNVAIPIAFNVASFPGTDVSPGDIAHYPDNSRFSNYLKPEELESATPKVQIAYGRPQMKGRKVFGELLKYGEVWRVGANESTEVTFFQNVMIGDKELRAGRYNLYAVVNQTEWTFIFNTDMPAWGSANRDEEKDVASITVPVSQESEVLEALSIRFKEIDAKTVHMIVGWDKTRAALPIVMK
jgi:hypothetical protein